MILTFRPAVLRSPLSSVVTALALVAPAAAQQAGSVPASVAVPTMNCTKPSDFMPTFRSTQELTRFQKSLDVYKACVDQYAQANSAKANELVAQARVYNDAANEAIKDINAYITALNDASKNATDKSPATQGGAPKISP